MKKITMFTMASCPYCKAALRYMEQLQNEYPQYNSLEIEKIDEKVYPDIADRYDYFYVPTYYVGDIKLHEGPSTLEAIKQVFDAALSNGE